MSSTRSSTLNLSEPANATILDGEGLGTIMDNDELPSLSINDVTVTEGNSGQSTPSSRSASLPPAARR